MAIPNAKTAQPAHYVKLSDAEADAAASQLPIPAAIDYDNIKCRKAAWKCKTACTVLLQGNKHQDLASVFNMLVLLERLCCRNSTVYVDLR